MDTGRGFETVYGSYPRAFLLGEYVDGTGIPDDLKENLFKPFNEAKDLAQGDGLGLPICALMASKLNGTLSIDKEYKKGCRFVLVLQI